MWFLIWWCLNYPDFTEKNSSKSELWLRPGLLSREVMLRQHRGRAKAASGWPERLLVFPVSET